MSISAKVILCGSLDLCTVGNAIIVALYEADKDYRKKLIKESGCNNTFHYNNQNPDKQIISTKIVSYDFDLFSINFSIQGVQRSLFMYPNAKVNYKHLNTSEQIFSFSINTWGCSDLIIDTVRKAVSQFGCVYWTYSDSEDELQCEPCTCISDYLGGKRFEVQNSELISKEHELNNGDIISFNSFDDGYLISTEIDWFSVKADKDGYAFVPSTVENSDEDYFNWLSTVLKQVQ